MTLLRVFGKLFLALAFAALAFDGARMLATPDEGLFLASLRDHFAVYAKDAEPAFRDAVLAFLPDFVWRWLLEPLLAAPVSLVLAGIGTVLFLLGYRRPPPEIVSERDPAVPVLPAETRD